MTHGRAEVGIAGGVKYDYCDETWNQVNFTYDLKPYDFDGVFEPIYRWNQSSMMMQLFHLFWSCNILRDIVNETNWYATTRTSDGNLLGGDMWVVFQWQNSRPGLPYGCTWV